MLGSGNHCNRTDTWSQNISVVLMKAAQTHRQKGPEKPSYLTYTTTQTKNHFQFFFTYGVASRSFDKRSGYSVISFSLLRSICTVPKFIRRFSSHLPPPLPPLKKNCLLVVQLFQKLVMCVTSQDGLKMASRLGHQNELPCQFSVAKLSKK